MRRLLLAMQLKRITGIASILGFIGLAGCFSSIAPQGPAPTPGTVPRFAYVVNRDDNTISMYTVNPATGRLRHNGYVVARLINPQCISVDPSGRFAYVTHSTTELVSVSAYSINAATGALTSIGANREFLNFPIWGTVDPSGRFVYVANSGGNNIEAYSINATTGTLTRIGFVPAGDFPHAGSIDPSGRFVYVRNDRSNDVSTYLIDATTGALTALPTVRTRLGRGNIAITGGATAVTYRPKFAYVANRNSNSISGYTVDPTTGALTSIGETMLEEEFPESIAVDPSGRFVYTANYGSNNVSAYTIDGTTGALSRIGSHQKLGFFSPWAVTVDPSGGFVYVANSGSNDVSPYIIGSQLIRPPGALRPFLRPVPAGDSPQFVGVDPSGQFVYVANRGSNNVSAYTIDDTTGAFTSIGTVEAGTFPTYVSVDPSGQFVYVVNAGSYTVSAYAIDSTTGALTSIGTVPAGVVPRSIAITGTIE